MRPYESVANRPLTCKSIQRLKIFDCSASDFITVSVLRRFRACMYKFLTMVTGGVLQGVHKVVIRFSFSVVIR